MNIVETLFYRQMRLGAVRGRAWSPRGRDSGRCTRKRVGAHVGRMALGVTAMALNFAAMIMLPLAEATVIGFSVPIFSTVLAALVLGEPTGKWRWGAVAAGFLGVLLIVQPGTGRSRPCSGRRVALVAALLTASVTVVIRRLGKTERGVDHRLLVRRQFAGPIGHDDALVRAGLIIPKPG